MHRKLYRSVLAEMMALPGKIRINFVFNVFLYCSDFLCQSVTFEIRKEKIRQRSCLGKNIASFRNAYYKLFSRKNILKYVSTEVLIPSLSLNKGILVSGTNFEW